MLDPESGESYETTVKLDPEFFKTVYRDHFAPPYYLTPLDGKSPPIVVTPSPPFTYYRPEKLILPPDTDDAYINSLLQDIRDKEVKISQQDDLIKKYEKLVALQDIEIANLKQVIADVTIPTPTEVPNAANN